ncbi:MAG: hypothetical protein U5L45_11150 [Saprospiraceae bacterium]|nr:hypothetical protein [Saprospiraceae bacterium]
MVHFSGFTRKMNHIFYFCASEASAKVPFNPYFEFMYGFNKIKSRLPYFLTFGELLKFPERQFMLVLFSTEYNSEMLFANTLFLF